MELAERLQRQLLEQSRSIYVDTPISEATARAFLATPRHRFVSRYREWGSREWQEVRTDNLHEHLATLYANRPLILFGEDDDDIPSTISMPSFVLRMLDLLRLEPGHRVFELGAGSGWNAGLMAHLVGPEGQVHSLEIIPEVAQGAAAAVDRMGLTNVHVVEGDGGEGYPPAAPRSFLGIVEPAFRAFKTSAGAGHAREEHYFGLWMAAERSLVLARDDRLTAYGSVAARDRLLERVRQWVDLGMPGGASFALRVYPAEAAVAPGPDEWLVTRKESKFLWSLSGMIGG